MAVDSKHPFYSEFIDDWRQMRDTYRGERIIKRQGVEYLPATSGMIDDGMKPTDKGGLAYRAYSKRAVFHDVVRSAVETIVGLLHHKPPAIELPSKLEEIRESATLRGESLELLLRRINEEQLITGRVGLLLDVPDDESATLPFVATYTAESILNWDSTTDQNNRRSDSMNFVSLDESGPVRIKDFEWKEERRYRILTLGDPDEDEGSALYRTGVFEGENMTFSEALLVEPNIKGATLEQIPFVIVNTKDIDVNPEEPALIGLSNIALAIYRGEADYRQSLFMQGQDTLVRIGVADGYDEPRIGANGRIDLPTGGDAKFIGTNSAGLPEMRQAIENDFARATRKSGELIDETSRAKESGEALTTRVAAKTVTLNQIALAGAFGLQQLLRIAAVWVGANPDEVVVTPNLDFIDESMTGQELVHLVTAKSLGAPIANETLHALMRERGMTELEFEDELKLINEEEPLVPEGSTDEDGPEDDGPEGDNDESGSNNE